LFRDLVVYESIVGSYFNLRNCTYLHDCFDFVPSSVILAVSKFLAKICLHNWNNRVKNWKVIF